MTGADAADFTLGANDCPTIIPQGSNCSINVFFYPKRIGPRSATLSINDDAAGSPQTVFMTGTGVSPGHLTFNPASLDFGTQNVGTTSGVKTLTMTNAGESSIDLIFSQFQFTGDYSEVSDTCFPLPNGGQIQPGHSCTVDVVFTPYASGTRNGTINPAGQNGVAFATFPAPPFTGTGTSVPLSFVPVTPCRVADTRLSAEGALAGLTRRNFSMQGGPCGLPANASAYALNVTVVPSGPLRWLTIWPSGQLQPPVSTLNSADGRIKANAAIVPAGISGDVTVYVTDPSQVILDVTGYFLDSSVTAGLSYFPLPPCRVVDTRNSNAPLGGPALRAGQSRDLPILMSSCGLPPDAQAYALNFSAVPRTSLSYLTTWPTGQTRPTVSTLNAPTGTVTANAAIVPAGQAGDISVFATAETDLIIDVNGYFGTPNSGGLSLYTHTLCRGYDSRAQPGAQPFEGTQNLSLTNTCNLPVTAQALVANATVIPSGPLSFVTLWPSGGSRPNASTLNAYDGSITSNMAIVPIHSGALNAFASDPTHLVLDVGSYFAP